MFAQIVRHSDIVLRFSAQMFACSHILCDFRPPCYAMMSDVERRIYMEQLAKGGEEGGRGGEDQGSNIPGLAAPLKRVGTSRPRQPQKSKKSRIIAGEKVSGNTAHLESFLEEAGCLPAKQVPKKSFVRVDSEESDFDVEEEFPSRRGAAKSTPGRGRGGKGGGRVCKTAPPAKSVQPRKVRPVAEVKKNVTTRPFIEASGKPVNEDFQSEEGEGDSGDSTQSEDEHGDSKSGGKAKAGRKVSRRPINL